METDMYCGDTFVERRDHPRMPVKLRVKYQTLEKYDADKIKKKQFDEYQRRRTFFV